MRYTYTKILGSVSRNIAISNCSTKQINIKSMKMASTQIPNNDLIFRQLFDQDTCTYTYLLADTYSLEAVLIDPVIEHAYRDAKLIRELGLKLKYAMNTHVHADHITGSGILKTLIPGCKSMLSECGRGTADIMVNAGDEVQFGNQKLEIRATPGHTNGCITFVHHGKNMAFTGDALLIRGCGRTDFQDGSADKLFTSIHSQIFTLPKHYLLYPAHDYKGNSVTTVDEELQHNPRLTKSREDFTTIMKTLNLPYPKKIDASVPANKVCGLYNLPEQLQNMLKEAKPL